MNFKLFDIHTFEDSRGFLNKILQIDLLNKINFALEEIYLVQFKDKNTSRGNHYHKETREIFYCIKGELNITLKYLEGCQNIVLNESSNKLLFVNKFVQHSFMSTKDDAMLLAVSDRMYDPNDDDTYFDL
jgi:dTDP-4-dehydrorhamnose 3,5-epimerase-like enzyme